MSETWWIFGLSWPPWRPHCCHFPAGKLRGLLRGSKGHQTVLKRVLLHTDANDRKVFNFAWNRIVILQMFSRRQRLVVLFDRQHQFKHPVKMYAVEVDVVSHCVKGSFFVQKLQILEKLAKWSIFISVLKLINFCGKKFEIFEFSRLNWSKIVISLVFWLVNFRSKSRFLA